MTSVMGRVGGFFAAVRSGEPKATLLSQNLALTFLVPVSLWMAADAGNVAVTALLWLIGAATFNALWLPRALRNEHPPVGLPQNIAAVVSSTIVFTVPEMGLLLAGFILMSLALGLFAGRKGHAIFLLLCVIASSFFVFQAGAITSRAWVLFALGIMPMAFVAVSFVTAELGHKETLLDRALMTSGGTAWGLDPDSVVRSHLGVGIPGVAIGTHLADAIHPDDHRPSSPEPGATLEYRVGPGDGSWHWIRESVEAASTNRNERRSNITDVTAEKNAIKKTHHQANYDQLTGQPNRASHIRESESWAKSGEGFLVLVDLDDFKEINDTLGHSTGDRVLKNVASRLATTVGLDHVARLGGDEFACLIRGDQEQVQTVAATLLSTAMEPQSIDSMLVYTGACAGIAQFEAGVGADEIRRRAGVALSEAKKSGGTSVGYDAEIDRESVRTRALAARLPSALANREFILHHQPKVDLATRKVVGFEALVRWQHPDEGLLAPDEFLDLISVGGLHRELYQLVLERALEDHTSMRSTYGDLTVAINVHARNLREADFVERTLTAIEMYGLAPQDVVLELTEDAFIGEDPSASEALIALNKAGIRLSIDDFGTGFSSLNYLNRLPVREVKLDRSLIWQAQDSERAKAVIESVLLLAARLELRVVAEGIEDLGTFDYLAEQGCTHAQGYYIGKPQPAEHWIALNASTLAALVAA